MSSGSDKALQEFLSEAQEIIEAYNRNLLRLDADRASGRFDPEALNDAFRAVHSLKSLSGLFGVDALSNLSHNLENLLDALRLSKVQLTPEVLDLLFEAGEQFHRAVARTGRGQATDAGDEEAAEDLIERIDRIAFKREPAPAELPWGGYDLDTNLTSVLTEYEEHRLRENIKLGRRLFRIHTAFDLLTIDTGLDDLKGRLKPVGEVITYLPSVESEDDSKIELDIILGADGDDATVRATLEGIEVHLEEMPRVSEAGGRAPVSGDTTGDAKEDAATAVNAPAVTEAPAGLASPGPLAEKPAAASIGVGGDGSRLGDSSGGDPYDPRGMSSIAGSVVAELESEPEEIDERPLSLRSVAQTVRVDIRKLDLLMNLVGELALARAGIETVHEQLNVEQGPGELSRSLALGVRQLDRKIEELQGAILEVRMVPLGQIFDKLTRVVRKISRESQKEVRFVISGADTELDKLIVEELSDPLMHLIRNCIDHGIETAEERSRMGKPSSGTVSVSAAQRGNHVVIEIEDDGGGVDGDKLIVRALERGVIDDDTAVALSRRDVLNLMFHPGISTKDVADAVSGRGVGMDVVKTHIGRLSGIIDIDSEDNQGTRFMITLPITLAIIQALVIRVAGRTYAVPLNSVLESLLLDSREIRTIEGREIIDLRGTTLPILHLEDAFGLSRDAARPSKSYVVVVGMAQHRVGMVVDELVGQQDIVIKSMGKALQGLPGIAGATELGNQQTVLVLDVAALVEEALSHGVEAA